MEPRYSKFVKRVRDTQVEEIDCSACLDQVSAYVDLELSRADAARQLPQVRQHLDQCGVCFEEYLLLRQLAEMEQGGRSPSPAELKDRLKKPPE